MSHAEVSDKWDAPTVGDPDWWRNQEPPDAVPDGWGWDQDAWISGKHIGTLPDPGPAEGGLTARLFFRANITDVDLVLNDVQLAAAWSQFDRCHFRQRVRPVLNEYGVAAQGSFGNRPTLYRDCTFERVRFKQLGGFNMDSARFERCTFIHCRWEGHFASQADLIDCVFVGSMNGCVWFGRGPGGHGRSRRNVIEGNDFTATQFTSNVGWRQDFPISAQTWPQDYIPLIDG